MYGRAVSPLFQKAMRLLMLLLLKILPGKVVAFITQFAEHVLNLFQSKRRRPGSTMFPPADGRKRDAELGREFLLTQPGAFPNLPNQTGYVIADMQLFSPLKLCNTLMVFPP